MVVGRFAGLHGGNLYSKTLLTSTNSPKSGPELSSVLGASSHSVVDMDMVFVPYQRLFALLCQAPAFHSVKSCTLLFGGAGDRSSTSPCCHLRVCWRQVVAYIIHF